MKYDLNLYSLNYLDGQLQDGTPGFYAVSARRRAARGRQEDSLIMLLTIKGGKVSSVESQREWLSHLSEEFFKTSGSVTTAMRLVIDSINLNLLERNLKLVEDSDRVSAYLMMGVIHNDTLFVAQCGPTHGFLIQEKALIHFFDQEMGERGLGLSRTPNIRYFQHAIKSGDYFIASPTPSQAWKAEILVKEEISTLEQLWRRLHHQMPLNQTAGLVQIISGEGKVSFMPSRQSRKATTEPVPAEGPVLQGVKEMPEPELGKPILAGDEKSPIHESHLASEPEEMATEAEAQADDFGLAEDVIFDLPSMADTDESDFQVDEESDDNQVFESVITDEVPVPIADQLPPSEPEPVSMPGPLLEGGSSGEAQASKPTISAEVDKLKHASLKQLAAILTWKRKTGESIKNFFTKISGKISPNEGQPWAGLSRGTMIIIAIAVPILVVALAVSVYVARGRDNQYQYFLAQAQAAATNAPFMDGTDNQREAWNEVMGWAAQAAAYSNSDEVKALVRQAQSGLDGLDGAVRLVYQPAIAEGILSEGVEIRQIIPMGSDLYLLDISNGRVLHLTLGNRGYTVNTNFVCQAGTYDGISIGSLVDVVAIPINNTYKAPVLAVDANGNILYCANGKQPVVSSLVPPDAGWGQIISMTYDSGLLYLLDASQNALWVYEGSVSEFAKTPRSYFDGFPLNITGAIDITNNGEELYILHADGHVSTCLAPGFAFSQLQCKDPDAYRDERVGATKMDFQTKLFTQMRYSPPPDPSLYMLEPGDAEIYQFSLRLNLNRIYRPELGSNSVAGKPATAFAIAANRNAYLAFANQLFYAVIP